MAESPNEELKRSSSYLRGTIREGLANTVSGSLTSDDQKLTKFHGMYQQDDRDVRSERRQKKLEPLYSFMIRIRATGGVATPEQWLTMDQITRDFAIGSLKITTRQTFQLHGVIKHNLKQVIRTINGAFYNTMGACGDINRNVICNPNPVQSQVRGEVNALAKRIARHFLPRSGAYHDLWLGDESGVQIKKIVQDSPPLLGPPIDEAEPLYGKAYMPRKFKVVIAVPPSNDVDVFAHDLGFIAILNEAQDEIVGYNVTVGGGMGMTHGKVKTFPRLGDVMGYCTPENALAVAEAVLRVQRDHGDREDRHQARLKYTVERLGLDGFRNEVEKLLGFPLEEARPYHFESNGDPYGWTQDHLGNWHFGLFIESGRVCDTPEYPLMTGLREIAKVHKGEFWMTTNQNMIIANISPEEKPRIENLLGEYGMLNAHARSGLRLNSMSCVALPSCGLALTEAQRFLPTLITQLEEILEDAGLRHDAITMRVTGCPNGCSRPYIAEIACVGKGPNIYNLYLGAGFAGQRLNTLYREAVPASEIASVLRPIIFDYALNRIPGEHFGDFTIRAGYVEATENGRDFQKSPEERAKERGEDFLPKTSRRERDSEPEAAGAL